MELAALVVAVAPKALDLEVVADPKVLVGLVAPVGPVGLEAPKRY